MALSPTLQRFARPAEAAPAIWRLLASLGVVFGALLLFGFGVAGVGLAFDIEVRRYVSGFETPVSAFIALASFLIWRPALWLAMRLILRRAYATLFGPAGRTNWRHFLMGLFIAALFAAISTAAALALVGAPYWSGGGLAPWLGLALLALPLIYIQSSAEELVFRGLILQHMAVRFGAFWAWGLIPSVLFGLLHWNPDGYGTAAWLVLAITGLTGLAFAFVTAATGNLGAAMGLHFGLNAYALLLIAPSKTFAGLALAHWPDDEFALNRLLAIDFATLAIACVCAAVLYRRSLRSPS